MNQLFKYAGISINETGTVKARFGNDLVSRVKKLKTHSEVFFMPLPEPMSRADACKFLLTQDKFVSADMNVKDALNKVVYRHIPKRGVKTV